LGLIYHPEDTAKNLRDIFLFCLKRFSSFNQIHTALHAKFGYNIICTSHPQKKILQIS